MTRLPWITPLLEVPLLLGLAASVAMAQVKYFSYPDADSPTAARSPAAVGSPNSVGSPMAESTPDYHHLLLVAYDVTKRHLGEWKEIPHVVNAYPGLSGRAVVIDVAADYPENVAAVERAMPHEVEGIGIVVVPDYRRLQAIADRVRKRHLGAWMKIPHVVGAGLMLSAPEVVINVEVDGPQDVEAVERRIPRKVEGVGVVVVPVAHGVLD